jgi:hypothetical protein
MLGFAKLNPTYRAGRTQGGGMKRIAGIILGWLALLTTAQADQPTVDQERQRAHVVSRMYQATYGAQERCGSYKDELARLDKVIEQVRHAYPELMRLVESSVYLPQAKEEFKALWGGTDGQLPIQECRETANMLQQLLEVPNGQQAANNMIQTLMGNSQLQSMNKNSKLSVNDTEDIKRPRATIDTQTHRPPLFVPFEAQKAGSTFTTELRVVEHRQYKFALLLQLKKGATMEDAKQLMRLAGQFGKDKNGKLVWPGISIPLRLKISVIDSSGEKITYDKEMHEEEEQGGGGMGEEKLIDSIELRPGRYRVSIQSLKNIPELAENPIKFGIFAWPNSNPID